MQQSGYPNNPLIIHSCFFCRIKVSTDSTIRHLVIETNTSVRFTPPATMANTAENRTGKPMWVQDQRNSWHGVEYPYHGRSNQSVEEMYRHYCEMILSIDESIGRIMRTLEAKKLTTETLILFTSDGGHLWGEHGLIDKRCAYEPSIRIPLIAYWPSRIKAGEQCEALVANIDTAPTMLDLAKLNIVPGMMGRSLLPLMKNPNLSN